jgi:hypothetical protein
MEFPGRGQESQCNIKSSGASRELSVQNGTPSSASHLFLCGLVCLLALKTLGNFRPPLGDFPCNHRVPPRVDKKQIVRISIDREGTVIGETSQPDHRRHFQNEKTIAAERVSLVLRVPRDCKTFLETLADFHCSSMSAVVVQILRAAMAAETRATGGT